MAVLKPNSVSQCLKYEYFAVANKSLQLEAFCVFGIIMRVDFKQSAGSKLMFSSCICFKIFSVDFALLFLLETFIA